MCLFGDIWEMVVEWFVFNFNVSKKYDEFEY